MHRGSIHQRHPKAPFTLMPCGINCYAVLAPVSKCYPPLMGRLPTCYSPVRHSSFQLSASTREERSVRLACIRHAASVRPEPGSNSPMKKYHPPTHNAGNGVTRESKTLTPNTDQKNSVHVQNHKGIHKQIRHIDRCIKKSLTIKDTLLSSQASHPPEQPHQQAGPPRGDPTNPTTPTPTPQNPRYQDQPAKPAKTVPPPRKAATRSTLPDQS